MSRKWERQGGREEVKKKIRERELIWQNKWIRRNWAVDELRGVGGKEDGKGDGGEGGWMVGLLHRTVSQRFLLSFIWYEFNKQRPISVPRV